MSAFPVSNHARTPAIYDNYRIRDTYSYESYGKFWTDPKKRRSLKSNESLFEERAQVISKLSSFSNNLPISIDRKHKSYSLKAILLKSCDDKENECNAIILKTMESIFYGHFKKKLLEEVNKISKIIKKVQKHFLKFQIVLQDTPPNSLESPKALRKTMLKTKKQLFMQFVNLNTRSINLDSTMSPAIYVIQQQAINQYQSVAEGAQHFYRLFLNVTGTLRNFEQGMIKCLENKFPGIAENIETREGCHSHSEYLPLDETPSSISQNTNNCSLM